MVKRNIKNSMFDFIIPKKKRKSIDNELVKGGVEILAGTALLGAATSLS